MSARTRLKTQPGDPILITGVTGRIGANLAKTLLDQGYRVRGITLPGDPQRNKLTGLDVEIIELDLRDAAAVTKACADVVAVVHLAALMGPEAGDMPIQDYWRLNVDATLNVLEAARQAGEQIVKFVFASSDAIYAALRPHYLPIDEHHPQEPINLYGLTKVIGERLCMNYLLEWRLPVTLLRYGAVATPDERLRPPTISTAMRQMRLAKQNHNNYLWWIARDCAQPWAALEPFAHDPDRLVAMTDAEGQPWVSHPTDVRDVVQGTILALENEAAVGEAFNILGPGPVASDVVIKRLAEVLDRPYVVVRMPFGLAYELSTVKARMRLGYRPQHDILSVIDDGLAMQRGADIGVIPGRVPS